MGISPSNPGCKPGSGLTGTISLNITKFLWINLFTLLIKNGG